MRKYLIIQTAFLGDVILSTVLIETIANNEVDFQIDFLIKKGQESILEENPHVNKILTYDKQNKTRSIISLIKSIRKEKYDYTINIHRFFSSGLITALSGSKNKIGYDKNPLSFLYHKKITHIIEKGKHEIDRIHDLVSFLNFKKIRRPKLYYSKKQIGKIEPLTKKAFVCIAPGSVWYTKRAPVEKWSEIVEINSTKKIYILGGQEDSSIALEIIQSTNNKTIEISNLCGKLSLMESAALMDKADHAYVNDSAPLHICSANNTSVTVLFCSTSTEFGFGPLSDKHEIIEVSNLKCRPCGIHGFNHCPKKHFDCGKKLEIN